MVLKLSATLVTSDKINQTARLFHKIWLSLAHERLNKSNKKDLIYCLPDPSRGVYKDHFICITRGYSKARPARRT